MPIKRCEMMQNVMGVDTVSARRVWHTTQASVHDKSRTDPLTGLRQCMRELAHTQVLLGCRRLRVLMQHKGWHIGAERFYRLSIEQRSAVRRKQPWRHVMAVHRERRRTATTHNDSWRMDVVGEPLAYGCRFLAQTMIDMCTRECLAIDGGREFGGHQVAATLERLRFDHGVPQRISCDDGPEFVSAALDLWAYTHGLILDVSRRGTPTDHAMIESFNVRFRADCLHAHWFTSLEDAQHNIDACRWSHHEHQPHRFLKGQSPREFAQRMLSTAVRSLWMWSESSRPLSKKVLSLGWRCTKRQQAAFSRPVKRDIAAARIEHGITSRLDRPAVRPLRYPRRGVITTTQLVFVQIGTATTRAGAGACTPERDGA